MTKFVQRRPSALFDFDTMMPAQRPPLRSLKRIGKGLNFQEILATVPNEPDNRNAKHVRVYRLNKKMIKTKRGKLKVVVKSVTITRAYKNDPSIGFPQIRREKRGKRAGQAKTEMFKPRLHRQRIEFLIDDFNGPFTKTTNGKLPKIVVDCDCKRWVFMWEYAMWQRRAARIKRGNGKPPVKTNPQMRPACCKHILRVLLVMKNKGW